MAIEKTFIKEGIKESQIENFLRNEFKRAGYSHTEIQRTPVGTRIVVYANKPGLVIGRSGKRVNEITKVVKEKFGFENPLIDVREVRDPMLDANIVASRIANSLERGIHYKRVCNFYLDKVMQAGAVGIQIEVAGKLAGVERSRFQKFRKGFVAHSGDYAEKLVDKGYAQAMLKPGIGGVQVKIMKEMPVEVKVKEVEEPKEEAEEKEEKVEEEKPKKKKAKKKAKTKKGKTKKKKS
jgi:small subunit ribosomal protein S3